MQAITIMHNFLLIAELQLNLDPAESLRTSQVKFDVKPESFHTISQVKFDVKPESFTTISQVKFDVKPESFRTFSQVNKFDVKGLKYHMPEHGIIPENAVNTDTVLSIGVYYINSFQLPKGHRLVSEVFWIQTSVPLHKNAEFYVPHFVKVRDEEDSNKLRFFMASDISTEEIQTLTEVPANSCSFDPESSYGKLVMKHFCSGCILERIDRNGLPLWYLITRVLPNDSEEKKKWTADIVFSYALTSCYRVCTHKCHQPNFYILL